MNGRDYLRGIPSKTMAQGRARTKMACASALIRCPAWQTAQAKLDHAQNDHAQNVVGLLPTRSARLALPIFPAAEGKCVWAV